MKIKHCNLKCWNAESSHFPILEKLVLDNLSKLEEIPGGIGEIPTLKLIRVHHCSNSAAISAVKIKEDQLENDDLQIKVDVSDYYTKKFKAMMETEGLTIKNIQFKTS